MSAATIPADVRQQLIAAGLTPAQIDKWLAAEDSRKPHPGAGPEQALRGLRLAGAPDSLVVAYVQACASPRRMVRDVVLHCGAGAQLAAAAATLLAYRVKAEARITTGSIWAEYRAAHGLPAHNSQIPGYLQ